MVDFIGLAKLALSKRIWTNVRDFYRFANLPPEWKRDITIFRAKIKRRDREYAAKFRHEIHAKMHQERFEKRDIFNFMLALKELTDNGFRHGCASDSRQHYTDRNYPPRRRRKRRSD